MKYGVEYLVDQALDGLNKSGLEYAKVYAALATAVAIHEQNLLLSGLSTDLRTILEVLVREVAPPEEPEPPRDYEILDMLSGDPEMTRGLA